MSDQPNTPRVVTLSDVEPERVTWLWQDRLPAGKLIVIDGDPSTGKSTLTLDLAARVSTGTDWPDGTPCQQADVLLLSAEDGLADTIKPRLWAAGADTSRVHALTEVPSRSDEGHVRMVPPSLPRDIPHIKAEVQSKSVKLVVIDVLMAYLNSGVDSHRDQDVRGVLHQLAAMAEATGCAIVLVRHLNKAGGSNAIYRGGGSIGIVGAARAAFLVARDPDDTDRRIFVVTKSNLALEPPALAYRLVGHPESGCARVEWEAGAVDYTANSLLAAGEDGEDRSQSGEAVQALLDILSDAGGSLARNDVTKAMKAEGYSDKIIRRAREKAKVESTRVGFPGSAVWSLPSVEPSKPLLRPHKSVGATTPQWAQQANPPVDGVASKPPAEHPSLPGTNTCRDCGNNLDTEPSLTARCRKNHKVKHFTATPMKGKENE